MISWLGWGSSGKFPPWFISYRMDTTRPKDRNESKIRIPENSTPPEGKGYLL